MSLLAVRELVKAYRPGDRRAVDGVSFSLAPGEVAALVGPSGCGKTTTLRLIAGFERPDGGEVELGGRLLVGAGTDLPPEGRGVGFVFQDHALFPHLSVLENAAFGLRGPVRARRERAREVLALVGLTVFADRLPHQLSGGQQQRVAVARALAPRPPLVLLDEPFSSLDAGLRASTRAEVRQLLASQGTTTLLVTHDQDEAMSFADRLIVMRDGRVEQDGPPEAVYRAPRTAFVAGFLGGTNLVPGTADALTVRTELGEVALEAPRRGPLLLSVRPEHLSLEAHAGGERGVVGVVLEREYAGHDVTFTVAAAGLTLLVRAGGDHPLRPGDRAWVRLAGPATPVGPSGE